MSNTKYKEIVRLLLTSSISQREVSSNLHVSRNTVKKVKDVIDEKGIKWEEVKDKTEDVFVELISPSSSLKSIQVMPDFDVLLEELNRPGVTRKLLWEEYVQHTKALDKIPYKYSMFCKLLETEMNQRNISMHKDYKPAEIIEVDWSGTKVPITDKDTGEVTYGYLFVACLPYSQYTYAEILPDMKIESWIGAHTRMYTFLGGVSSILICDNLKTGILSHPKVGEWVENPAYREMADYYDTAILPTPVRSPKAKASVEGSVGKLTSNIIARMRNLDVYNLDVANKYCKEFLHTFNSARFQKRDGSRLGDFLEYEKPYLKTLPSQSYEYGQWKIATVQKNYHIAVDKMYYSVPYKLVNQKLRVRISAHTIDIYQDYQRVSSHVRLYGRSNQYSTNIDHMPEKHKKANGYNSEYFLSWAKKIGESTYQVITNLLKAYKVEQQSYSGCSAILHLSTKFNNQSLEKACELALSNLTRAARYRDIKAIITYITSKQEMDKKTLLENNNYALLRGKDYYGEKR